MLKRSYKHQLINEEVLIKCMHQHWRLVTRPMIYTVLLVVPLVLILAAMFDTTWGRVLFGLVAVVGLAAWGRFALPPLVRWYSVSYAVTSRRVLFRHGVVNKRFEQVDLMGVANPVLDRTGWDVVFRSGTINLGGGHQMERIPRAKKVSLLIAELAAAHQTKDVRQLTHTLKNLGFGNVTMN